MRVRAPIRDPVAAGDQGRHVGRSRARHRRSKCREALTNLELYVSRDKLPAAQEDEFYHADLIACGPRPLRAKRSAASSRW